MSTIITHRQFPNYHKYEMELAGRPLTLEVGKLAELANAAVMVGYGDTRVLVCATASARPRDGIDFFPLSVDFEEKLYSVGRIPGSFNRREGRPGEKGILTSRVIDRPIRPLFPSDFRNDVSIMATVMSVDHDCSPEIAALIGTSAALAISDIPWNGPVGALKVGLVNGELVLNPNSEQRKVSDLDVTVVSTGKKVVMIEAGANEVDNDTMYKAIELAHNENQKQVELINRMVAEIGKPKFDYPHASFNQELFDKIVENFMDEAKAAMDTDDKNVREARWNEMIEHWHEKFLEEYPDMDQFLDEITYKFQKKIVKAWLLEGHRVDGRQKNEIRPLAAEVGVLPRVHGSGLFTRGQTQVLSVCTLDTLSAAQKLDTIWEETEKRYMHHYNFPGYSVGEAIPEQLRIVHQIAGQNVERIIPLGHQVADPYAAAVRFGIGRTQRIEVFAADSQRLVRQHMISGFHRREDITGFLPVVSGQDDQVAGTLADHPLEVVGTGIDHLPPGGRLFRTSVVGGYGRQILFDLLSFRGIDTDRVRKLRKGVLLQQARMEMARIEHDQTQGPLSRTSRARSEEERHGGQQAQERFEAFHRLASIRRKPREACAPPSCLRHRLHPS